MCNCIMLFLLKFNDNIWNLRVTKITYVQHTVPIQSFPRYLGEDKAIVQLTFMTTTLSSGFYVSYFIRTHCFVSCAQNKISCNCTPFLILIVSETVYNYMIFCFGNFLGCNFSSIFSGYIAIFRHLFCVENRVTITIP